MSEAKENDLTNAADKSEEGQLVFNQARSMHQLIICPTKSLALRLWQSVEFLQARLDPDDKVKAICLIAQTEKNSAEKDLQ